MIRTGKLRRWIKRNITHTDQKFDKVLPYDLGNNYNRTAIVYHACQVTNAKNYLEIGCAQNHTFSAMTVAEKVGVDPKRGGTHRMTSDEFFAQNKEKFDVIFIDGIHTYEQVHRDIANALKALKKGGFIILDDMLPLNWQQGSAIMLMSDRWVGSCWKCSYEIMATEGLDYKVILCGNGTGVIKPRENHAPLKDLSAELTDKKFDYLYENHEKMPTIDFKKGMDWMTKSA